MDILLTIVYCLIVLCVLVFIHEGGHFLAARMFGVRVTEFMIGLPGPHIGFRIKETLFGITCIPLGGYAKVCGMEPGNIKQYLPDALKIVHQNGKARVSKVASYLKITREQAQDALDELVEWGCVDRADSHEDLTSDIIYYASEINGYEKGQAREVLNKENYFKYEYFHQYRSLSFTRRSIVILSGIVINILFAMIVFVLLYSVVGYDVKSTSTGMYEHVNMSPITAIQFGLNYVWSVIIAVLGLFNPATAQQTLSNSTSLIGIAVISKSAADHGIFAFFEFMAMISVSLGIMNLIPIPILDGGRFIIEVIQKITGKNVPEKASRIISFIGIAIILVLFVVLITQDSQRFLFN